MANPSLPFDYTVEQNQLARQQAMTDQMAQALLRPRQGQMVGRHYVGVSPLDAIAQVAGAYLNSKQQEDLDTQTKQLGQRYNQAVASGLDDYWKTRVGAPAQFIPSMTPTVDNDPANPKQVQIAPAVAGDPRRAAVNAIASGLAPLQQIGMEDLKEQAKGQLTAKDLVGHADPSSIPSMIAQGITGFKPKVELKAYAPGEVLLDSSGKVFTPHGEAGPNGGPGWGLKSIGGDLYQTSATGLKKLDNAPKVNVNTNVVNKGESEFMKGIGDASAKDLIAARQAKVAAQRTIQSMQKLDELDRRGVMSGPGAPVGMFLGSLAESMGLPVDKNKLATSQAYQGELMNNLTGQLTTGSLARSTTDKDMEILKAPLPELLNSPEGRAALRRQAVARAQEHIDYADALGRNASQAFPEASRLLQVTPGTVNVPQRMDVPAAGGYSGPTPSWLPPGAKILNVREK